jgi:hypothetical protein
MKYQACLKWHYQWQVAGSGWRVPGGEWQVASDTLCMSRYECVSHAAGIGADRDRPVRCLQSVVQSGLRFC